MAKESHIPGVLKFVDEQIAKQRRELAKQDDNKKKAVTPLDLSHIDKVIDDELARLRQRNSDDQANKAQALSDGEPAQALYEGIEGGFKRTIEKNGVSDEQIKQQANELLDRWNASPNGLPVERKGDIVKAFINYGNRDASITPENLREWYPEYTREDLNKLGRALLVEAARRDQEEGGNLWRYIVEF